MNVRAAHRTIPAVALLLALRASEAGAYYDPDRFPTTQGSESGTTTGGGGTTSGGSGGSPPTPADDGEDGTYTGAAFLCSEEDPHQCHGSVGLACEGLVSNEVWLGMSALAALTPLGGVVQIGALVESAYFGCPPTGCLINAGSWDHDECCFDHATGHWCGPENATSTAACVASWNRAIHRTTHGLSWRRDLNQCRIDTDGAVNFSEYCAPNGTIVAAPDAAKCCSGRTRSYNLALDYSRLVFQPVVFDGTFTPVVCTSTTASSSPSSPQVPPANQSKALGGLPPQPCTSNGQCGYGEICYAGHCVAV